MLYFFYFKIQIKESASFFYDLYNLYPSHFYIDDKFLDDIQYFPDPILKYVALYFYYNYLAAKDYFAPNSNNNNFACNNLNRCLLLLDLYYLIEVEGKKDYNSSSWKKWHINNLKDLEITIHIREMEELACITNLCKNKLVNISINIDFINKMV
ncbi:hypothetical protein PVIIG_03143 [Plasmodium vivax India VII]|uniref:Uncharacterized protein n=1 Tax=Plasmodium vivax India VII TaxID=1077284 RepID=A0A0J9SDS0_PLAVI|nr:hypothetical protein PVIIG_03143 [Plasmodium vivax India VII]